MAVTALSILLLMLPLAVAGQNIGTGVAGLMFFFLIWQRRRHLPLAILSQHFSQQFLIAIVLIVTLTCAGIVNPMASAAPPWNFLAGYLIWLLLPPVVFLACYPLNPRQWRFLFMVLAIVALFLGVIASSQLMFGWRLEKTSIVAAELRARGFYSHPLTFAYAQLLLFPLAVAAVLNRPRDVFSWLFGLGVTASLLASQSRAVQAVAVLLLLMQCGRYLRGKARRWTLGAIFLVLLGIMATKNPVSARFQQIFDSTNDVESNYLDDRFVFWNVHWQMFKDRPWLGHGMNTDTAYRTPYYQALGLGGMVKKYEAHNTYLQMAVNGGILACALFVIWAARAWLLMWRRRDEHWAIHAAAFTWGGFLLASVVQNSIQDSEVRYTLTLLVAAQLLSLKIKASLGSASQEKS